MWHQLFTQQQNMLPMQQLEDLFHLSLFDDWPNAEGLNQLKTKIRGDSSLIPEFVCQSMLEPTEQYYEQIIYQQNIIPTRPNSWHDLFNGLIWLQFPKTKRLLNQQHVEDIQQFGLSPRTLRRNNLTHFDECGVIVTYQDTATLASVIDDLAQHRWTSVFVENRKLWGKQLQAFVFGHANLEMLLQPFIGLTGKWLALKVDAGFESKTAEQQLAEVDYNVVQLIQQGNVFAQKKPLLPLPLLGIPGFWDANNNPEFYANTDYFRPKSKAKPPLK